MRRSQSSERRSPRPISPLRRTLATTLALLLPATALAGSAPAELKCSPLTEGSDMHVEGTVPASEDDFELQVYSRGSRYALTFERYEAISVESFEDGVYTLVIRSEKGVQELALYAIPGTFEILEKRPGRLSANFAAGLTAVRPSRWSNPSKSYEDFVHNVKMSCSYRYSI